MAALFVLLLSLVPGLPAFPFMLVGVLLLVASRARTRRIRAERKQAASEPVQRRSDDSDALRFIPVVVPWSLSVSSDLEPLQSDNIRGGRLRRAGFRSAGNAVQEALFRDLGVPLPSCQIQVDAELPERHVVLSIHEVPATVLAIPETISAEAMADFVVAHVAPVLQDRAADFVGIAETQTLLDGLQQVAPATVRQVVPNPVSVTLLADVLRRLLEERVSVRDLKGILESLSQTAEADKDPLNLAEYVRAQMRRTITHELTRGGHELVVHLLDQPLEDAIRGAISRTSAGSFLTLAPAAGRDIVAAIRTAISGAHASATAPPVLLTQPDVRRFVRKLVETDLPELRVVSYAELLPEIAIKPVAKATLAGL